MSRKNDNRRTADVDYSHFFTSDEDSSDDDLPLPLQLWQRKSVFNGVPERQKARKSLIDRVFKEARDDEMVAFADAPLTSTGRKRIFLMPERQSARKSLIDRNCNDLVSSTPLNSAKKTFNKSVPLSPIPTAYPEEIEAQEGPISKSVRQRAAGSSPKTRSKRVKPVSRSVHVQTDSPPTPEERVREAPSLCVKIDENECQNAKDCPFPSHLDTGVRRSLGSLGADNYQTDSSSDGNLPELSWISTLLRKHTLKKDSDFDHTSSKNDTQDQHQTKASKISSDIIPNENSRKITAYAKVLFPFGGEVAEQSTRLSRKHKTDRKGTIDKFVTNKEMRRIVNSESEEYDSHNTYYGRSVADKGSRVNTLCDKLRQRSSALSTNTNECSVFPKTPTDEDVQINFKNKNNNKTRNRAIEETPTNRIKESTLNNRNNFESRQENEETFVEYADSAVTNTTRNKKNIKSRKQENETSTDRIEENTLSNKNNDKSRGRENETFLEIYADNEVQNITKNRKNVKSKKRANKEISSETFIDKATKNTSKNKNNDESRDQENEKTFLEYADSVVTNTSRNKKNVKSRRQENEETSTSRLGESTLKNRNNDEGRKQKNEETLLEYTDSAVTNTTRNKKNIKSRKQKNEGTSTNRLGESMLKNRNNDEGREQTNEETFRQYADSAVTNTTRNKKNVKSKKQENETSTDRIEENTLNNKNNDKSRGRENETFLETYADNEVQNISKNRKKVKSNKRANKEISSETFIDKATKNTSKNKNNNESREQENEEMFLEHADSVVTNTSRNKKNVKSRKQEDEETSKNRLGESTLKNRNNDKSREREIEETSTNRMKESTLNNKNNDKENEETFLEYADSAVANTTRNKKNVKSSKQENQETSTTDRSKQSTLKNRKNDKSREQENKEAFLLTHTDAAVENTLENNRNVKSREGENKEIFRETSADERTPPTVPNIQLSCSIGESSSVGRTIAKRGRGNSKVVIPVSNDVLNDTPDMPLENFLSTGPEVSNNTVNNEPRKSGRGRSRKKETSINTNKENRPIGPAKKRTLRKESIPKITLEESGLRRSTRDRKPRALGYVPAVLISRNSRLFGGNYLEESSIVSAAPWFNLTNASKTDSVQTSRRTTNKTMTTVPKAKSQDNEVAESIPSTSHATEHLPSIREEEHVEMETREQQIASLRSHYKRRDYLHYPKNNKLRKVDWHVPEFDWKAFGDGESMRMSEGCKSAQAGFQGGYLEILPGKSKPKEMITNFAVNFLVMEGVCYFHVHDSYTIAKKYSNVQVPLGAYYSIINASEADRVLIFYTKVKRAVT